MAQIRPSIFETATPHLQSIPEERSSDSSEDGLYLMCGLLRGGSSRSNVGLRPAETYNALIIERYDHFKFGAILVTPYNTVQSELTKPFRNPIVYNGDYL